MITANKQIVPSVPKNKKYFKPFLYPTWIHLSVILLLSSILIFLFEIPYYIELSKSIRNAERAFFNYEYKQALCLYSKILLKHPNCKRALIRVIQSNLSLNTKEANKMALNYLKNVYLTKPQIIEIIKHIQVK